MKTRKENIAVKLATTTPEEIEVLTSHLITCRVTIGLLKNLRDDGKLSDKTYRRAVKEVSRNLGFSKNSIFTNET